LNLIPPVIFALFLAAFIFASIWWLYRRRFAASRFPFADDVLRPPGFSTEEKRFDLATTVIAGTVASIFLGAIAGLIFQFDTFAAIAVLVAALALAVATISTFSEIWNYNLGLIGEQIVGTTLTELLAHGCKTFHDLEVKSGTRAWNIDHIVIGPPGVFCIETKTRRKRPGRRNWKHGDHKVFFDGRQLDFPWGSDRHGLEQVHANSRWLAAFLSESVGITLKVTPILVLPGWWIEDTQPPGVIRVANQKTVGPIILRHPSVLSPQQVTQICHQVRQRCRITLQ
jgi:hypothetical protein